MGQSIIQELALREVGETSPDIFRDGPLRQRLMQAGGDLSFVEGLAEIGDRFSQLARALNNPEVGFDVRKGTVPYDHRLNIKEGRVNTTKSDPWSRSQN